MEYLRFDVVGMEDRISGVYCDECRGLGWFLFLIVDVFLSNSNCWFWFFFRERGIWFWY